MGCGEAWKRQEHSPPAIRRGEKEGMMALTIVEVGEIEMACGTVTGVLLTGDEDAIRAAARLWGEEVELRISAAAPENGDRRTE